MEGSSIGCLGFEDLNCLVFLDKVGERKEVEAVCLTEIRFGKGLGEEGHFLEEFYDHIILIVFLLFDCHKSHIDIHKALNVEALRDILMEAYMEELRDEEGTCT